MISLSSPRSRHCLARSAPRIPTFLPPAASVARATADSISSLMNLPVIQSGTTAGGSWVRTKYGPVHAPP